jgi:hypothetical protein
MSLQVCLQNTGLAGYESSIEAFLRWVMISVNESITPRTIEEK